MTSNETKRDVFDEVRYKFRNFKNEHRHGMYVSPDSVDHYLSDALKRYYAALPDDLPVIPAAVSEYIKNLRKYHRDLVDVFGKVRDLGITRTEPNGVLIWVAHNTDVFARAWVLGVWRVEETGLIVKLESSK
ncbi:MAG: hypothetical protein ABF858_06775 [Lacticaseibacillus paracasei]